MFHFGWIIAMLVLVIAGGKEIVEWLVEYNTVMVVCVVIMTVLLFWYYGLSWLSSFVAGTLAIFLTYKVGHQQFTWSSASTVIYQSDLSISRGKEESIL